MTNPFSLLSEIASKSRSLSRGLPEKEQAIELWSGIGFMLGGQKYAAAMGEVVEILHLPKFTRVPGVKPWVYGVSNVRGRLLPLLDLGFYFGLPANPISHRDKRILVIEQDDLFSGLAVDGVLGMQYFAADGYRAYAKEVPETLQNFIQGSYSKNDEEWKVFSTVALGQTEDFLDVATQ